MVKTPGGARTARVFFALWPDEPVRAALGDVSLMLKRECGGRAMAAANIHATLVFIGNVPAGRVPELEAIADGITGSSFELAIDALSYWKHNRIVWAGSRAQTPALAALAGDFRSALMARAWRVDERPYVLHVTLLRDAHGGPACATLAPIAWRVDEFALVLSQNDAQGTHYTPLRFWRLSS